MRDLIKKKSDRVGLYLNPHTRNRLNKLKADMTLATGTVATQDDVILMLLDYHASSAFQFADRKVTA